MAASKVQIQPLTTPPVDQAILESQPTSSVSESWKRWFLVLQNKINVITALIANIGTITTPGIIITDGNGDAVSRTIIGTGGDITVINGNGVAGNPAISSSPTGVTAGSYTSANITVEANGKISAASNGSGGGGGAGDGYIDTNGDLYETANTLNLYIRT